MKKILKILLICLVAFMLRGCGYDQGPENGGPSNPYLTWDPNSESDLTGYIVYWGEGSRTYSISMNVKMDRVVFIKDLETLFPRTYFAVTAYDLSGNESDYSNEVNWKP